MLIYVPESGVAGWTGLDWTAKLICECTQKSEQGFPAAQHFVQLMLSGSGLGASFIFTFVLVRLLRRCS
jgi:hypothetical protein